jgi:ABC-2 type transport system ATP-binding protein
VSIEPDEGNCREAWEARRRVTVTTWRGSHEGIAARTAPATIDARALRCNLPAGRATPLPAHAFAGLQDHGDAMAPVLETHQLTKAFGRTVAVRGVSLHIDAGETFGFLGRNGAGKSTFLQLVCGLLVPDAGEITLLGRRARSVPASARRDIGYVAQEPRFDPWMNAVALGRFVAPFFPGFDARFYDELLDLLGVPRGTRSEALSVGLRTRLALALALAHRPKLLVLDEPTAGLDPLARHEFHALLRETGRRNARATFFSSHLVEDVEKLADRVAIIHAGVLEFVGPFSLLTDEVRVFPQAARAAFVEDGALLGEAGRVVGLDVAPDELVGRASAQAWERLGVPARRLSFEDALVAVICGRRDR